uniref:Uncharacterized protein n=1 Tax=Moniliophthora roreri TaxID=221103 RepID=A0A0W0FNY3_MONRR
MESFKLLT